MLVVCSGSWEVVGDRHENRVREALLLITEGVFDAAPDSCR